MDNGTRRAVASAARTWRKARDREREARQDLIDELRAARVMEGAKLRELGVLCGVTRQRIAQLLKGDS